MAKFTQRLDGQFHAFEDSTDFEDKVADLSKEMCDDDEMHTVFAPLKGKKRAREKVNSYYDGLWSKLTDLIRASLVVNDVSDLREVVDELESFLDESDWEVASAPDNRFAQPQENTKYRDLKLLLKNPDGLIMELQIHVKSMFEVKMNDGHKLYEQTRRIADKPDLDENDRNRLKELEKTQSILYIKAWRRSQ